MPRPPLLLAGSLLVTVCGCVMEGEGPVTVEDLEGSSNIVQEGTSRLEFAPPSDGFVYVHDADDDTLVLVDRRLGKGQSFAVDPQNNRIEIDGERITDRLLKANHRYRIFFRTSNGSAPAPIGTGG